MRSPKNLAQEHLLHGQAALRAGQWEAAAWNFQQAAEYMLQLAKAGPNA